MKSSISFLILSLLFLALTSACGRVGAQVAIPVAGELPPPPLLSPDPSAPITTGGVELRNVTPGYQPRTLGAFSGAGG